MRLPRLAAALALAVIGLSAASPALAAGTGGIEVTPLATGKNGRAATAFHVDLHRKGSTKVSFALRNVADAPRTGRIYVAEAHRAAGGQYDVGSAGSSPYVSYRDQQVSLRAGEVRRETFTVARGSRPMPKNRVYAAVVVEVANGAVVQRAATLIYLEPQKPFDLPIVAVIGVALVLVMGAAVVSARSHERVPPGFDSQEG